MRLEWNRNQLWILLLTVFIVLLANYLLFKVLVAPKQGEVEDLKQKVQTEQQILDNLQEQASEQQKVSLATSRELQTQLPVMKVPDQVLLALEKVEGVSEGLIQNIVVTDGLQDNKQEGEADVESQEAGVLPSGTEALTLELEMASQSFEGLLTFLNELTDITRIVSIDSISFDNEKSEINGVQVINYSITMSAYYYPGLPELEDELPRYHFTTESNKLNPLPYGNGETGLSREDAN